MEYWFIIFITVCTLKNIIFNENNAILCTYDKLQNELYIPVFTMKSSTINMNSCICHSDLKDKFIRESTCAECFYPPDYDTTTNH